MNKPIIKIATRGSKLALYQANKVKEILEKNFPNKHFELNVLKTKGDKILDVALSKIGDKGLFTKELENSLLEKESDIAVHSLKDMPTELPLGLQLCGVLERGEVRDALVSRYGKKISELDHTDIIATSSLRRKAQLLHLNSNLKIVDIRGNVDTRLQKMEDGYCTAMIMASAGLIRLGYSDKITDIISTDIMLPAVSQGAIAMETRSNDLEIESLVSFINHKPTFMAINAEREFLRFLQGGCQIPIGCYSEINNNRFKITGFVSNLNGEILLKQTMEGEQTEAIDIAKHLAEYFLENGAGEIIQNIREINNI